MILMYSECFNPRQLAKEEPYGDKAREAGHFRK
jgi:hypothetical protein